MIGNHSNSEQLKCLKLLGSLQKQLLSHLCQPKMTRSWDGKMLVRLQLWVRWTPAKSMLWMYVQSI